MTAIENGHQSIVTFPMNTMVIFHSCVTSLESKGHGGGEGESSRGCLPIMIPFGKFGKLTLYNSLLLKMVHLPRIFSIENGDF